ncbi:MAG: hypothetical protein QOE62_4120 [Actinomycetota bacterium]|jgi:hypothetical protein|nr:hypothetical protein [Actinomycetota bacterium]
MKTIDAHAHFIPADLVADLRCGDGPDGMILEENSGVPWVVRMPPRPNSSAPSSKANAELHLRRQDGS